MVTLIIYIIVALILGFIAYIGVLGINRGVQAKNYNKNSRLKNKKKSSNELVDEFQKLKKLHDDGVLSKSEFNAAKKKILS
tara:strand:+ start:592 stop:834 length:243 start_codon:yes stop_codon:yes gene_type:complete